jgi:hypothetical protein
VIFDLNVEGDDESQAPPQDNQLNKGVS